MSRNGYATPLPIELHTGARHHAAWFFAVIASAVLITTLALSVWVQAGLILATLLLGWREWRRHFGPEAPTALLWQAGEEWLLSTPAGIHRARLTGRSFVTPRLIVLNLRLEGGRARRSVLLTPSRCDSETLRRLRVRLRLEQAAPGKEADS